jgi:hypothetical protein
MIVPINQFGFEFCEDLSTSESFKPISKSKNATIKPNIGPNDPREQGESDQFEIWFESVAHFEIEKITKPLQIHGDLQSSRLTGLTGYGRDNASTRSEQRFVFRCFSLFATFTGHKASLTTLKQKLRCPLSTLNDVAGTS